MVIKKENHSANFLLNFYQMLTLTNLGTKSQKQLDCEASSALTIQFKINLT